MKILAIDPGYAKCGWAVLAKGEQPNYELKSQIPTRQLADKFQINSNVQSSQILKSYKLQAKTCLITCDCIETDAKKELPDRLKEIYDEVEYIIKKYQPRELAIENLFFFKNQKTVMQVSQARGVIIAAAKNYDLKVYEYTPLQVKQAVVGYGRGDKSQVQKMIKLHLSGQKMPIQDDMADAVAVGLTHLQTNKLK